MLPGVWEKKVPSLPPSSDTLSLFPLYQLFYKVANFKQKAGNNWISGQLKGLKHPCSVSVKPSILTADSKYMFIFTLTLLQGTI